MISMPLSKLLTDISMLLDRVELLGKYEYEDLDEWYLRLESLSERAKELNDKLKNGIA